MIADFLPSEVSHLTEPTSIALVQQIQCSEIATPLSPTPIATTYTRQGSGGPPILLLHGFDSSLLEFRRLLPLLAARQETWAVDLLGFGFTDRPPQAAIDPAAIRTHLFYFWKTLIGRPVTLVGASMGGAAAIDFATTYPDSVERLVLINSAGFTEGPPIGKYLFPPLGYLAAEFLRRPAVRRKISLQAYFDPAFVTADALLCATLHLNCPRWHQAMIRFTRSGGYLGLKKKLTGITQPTLILWGDSDRILGIADAEKLHQAIRGSQLIWIPNCGHVPHLECASRTAQEILSIES